MTIASIFRPIVKRGGSIAFAVALLVAACGGASGTGTVTGELNVPDCWSGKFDLAPDFFAATPYDYNDSSVTSLTFRIQRGSDSETFSDGLSILIDDTTPIRPSSTSAGEYGKVLTVDLSAGVAAPGVPIIANANPAPVHMELYLQKSCQTQQVALYALAQVTLPGDGTCDAPEVDSADPASGCIGSLAAGEGTGKSTIAFTSLFDGDPTESSAAARLNKGCFDVYLADPRDVDPGGLGPPPKCLGHLHGNFDFYFERGRPEQAFP